MRRTLGLLVVALLAAAAVVVAVDSRQAGAQSNSLTIVEREAHVYLPFDNSDPNAERVPVMVVKPGEEYRFQVNYEVGGAGQIVTGNVFNFEQSVSEDPVRNTSMTFPPEPPGNYNESTTFRVPDGWDAGVYRFRYRVMAEAEGLEPVAFSGEASFLVSPSAR